MLFLRGKPKNTKVRLVVGLGNPGFKYTKTRHNMGFLALDLLEKQCQVLGKSTQANGAVAQLQGPAGRVLLVWPQTFMNLSGQCVAKLFKKNGCTIENVLVLYDDIDLPTGRVRIRPAGGTGTHNGMKSLAECLGTTDFPRIRIGVGPCPSHMDLAQYVLQKPPPGEWEGLNAALDTAANAALAWANGQALDAVMNQYNTK